MKVGNSAEILKTHTPELFNRAVVRASGLLKAGKLAALPTETVYGLAANALDEAAVSSIFKIKARPAGNPVIVHVCDIGMARRCVRDWPAVADKLAAAFWPGPLTLVLPKSEVIPDVATANGPTVGVRWPSHPFIQAVIRECGFPIAAPSANLSNEVSPTNAEHVRKTLGNKIPLIVDGGQSQVGIESTVVDLTVRPPRILRPGMIHLESLAAVIGNVGSTEGPASSPLKSPGQLSKHYSPKAKVLLCSWNDEQMLVWKLGQLKEPLSAIHIIAHTHIPLGIACNISVIPRDPEAFARALYAEFHRCDEGGAKLIIVESVPDEPRWHAISDRLRRAAGT